TGQIHGRKGRCVRLDHALGQAIMVAQIDEDQPAMIAPAIDPARQPDGLSDIGLAKLAAIMGAIGVHRNRSESVGKAGVLAVYGGPVKGGPHRAEMALFDAISAPSKWRFAA